MCLFTNRSACIKVLPLYSFNLPYFSSQLCKVRICGRHVMASVRDVKIAEALVVLCLAYYVMKQVLHCWNWGVMAFTYRDMGHAFHRCILRIFYNGWMDCRGTFHAVLSLYLLYNRQNTAEYEVYWLMGFTIIKLWGTRFTSTFSVLSVMAGWITGILSCCSLLILLCNKTKQSWVQSILAYQCSNNWSLRRVSAILSCKAVASYMQIQQLKLLFSKVNKQV